MKKWFKYFVCLSLLFLIFTLVRNDSLHIPNVVNPWYLVLSIGFLFAGFLSDAFAWYAALRVYGYSTVKPADAITGMGLSVFGKYIPGKVWILLGRSAYVAKKNKIKESEAAAISVNAQFIALWVGLIFGIGLFLSRAYDHRLVILAIGILVALSLLLFSGYGHQVFSLVGKKVFKREIRINRLTKLQALHVMPFYALNWLLWCAGFYCMIQSLSFDCFSPLLGLNFALAATLGIAVVIAPGGIGVREGVLVALLVTAGLEAQLATSVAVFSRLWFLGGESFMFLLGLVLKAKMK